jgi:hypothetical protein
MVGLKRPSKGSKFSMKTTPAAVPHATPPLGFKHPPTLIDEKSIDPSVIALRAKNYAAAYADPLMRQKWNMYVSFGIQQFVCPHEYVAQRAQETVAERHLRLARYYRYHLETLAPVDSYLLRTMSAVETALAISHPGFFDMSTHDMDNYTASLPENAMLAHNPTPITTPEVATITNDPNPTDGSKTQSTASSLAMAAAKSAGDDTSTSSSQASDSYQTQDAPYTDVPVTPKRSNQKSDTESTAASTAMDISEEDDKANADVEMSHTEANTIDGEEVHLDHDETKSDTGDVTPTDEFFGVKSLKPIPLCDTTEPIVANPPPRASPEPTKRRKNARKAKGAKTSVPTKDDNQEPVSNNHPPKSVDNTVRIEVRWAPKDFHELRASSEKMFSRLAPILSCFNTKYTWMIEWQNDQMEDSVDIDPTKLAKYLSIRIVPVVKERAFYFSFRICATGSQFTQVVKSEIMKTAKAGEHMSFDPTLIPPQQGELIFVGDILLKDATNTHRGNYLRYLRKEVLPPDTPAFDIKVRHKDPVGNSVKILAVRCGKATSTRVAEILSTALCGEGTNTEIFISRLAIGANQTSKKEHERIYQIHMEYLKDLVYIPFANSAIDTPVTEYMEAGITNLQTPRHWAKSLVAADGTSLEIDLENGKADGSAIIMTPSASAAQVKAELANFWKRQNPTLSNAKELYTASLCEHPDIPKTVFTKNIDTILAKKFKNATATGNADAMSPASSLTGATSKASTIAWKTPLQETLQKKTATPKKPLSSNEINQLKRIAILEAQLAINATTDPSVATSSKASKSSKSRQSTKASRTSSQTSAQSPLTAASAHSRLDSLEDAMQDIRRLLQQIATNHGPPHPANDQMQKRCDDTQRPPEAKDSECEIQDPPSPPTGKGMKGVQLFPDGMSDNTSLALLSTPKKSANKRQKSTSSPPPTSNLRPQYKEPPGARGGDTC